MVAAPYKISLVVALGSPNGARKVISMTASDVNAAFWLFPSGGNELPVHGLMDAYLVDAILSAAGTDTSQSEVYINGSSTGFKLLNATSLGTVVNRPLQLAPIRVPAGQTLKVTQLT